MRAIGGHHHSGRSALLLLIGFSGIVLISPASAQANTPSWNDLTRGALSARSAHPKLGSTLDSGSARGQARPASRDPNGRVQVSVTGKDSQAVLAAIAKVGGEVQLVAPGSTVAAIDPTQLAALSDDPAVDQVDAPRRPKPDLTSEGVDDFNTANRIGATSAHAWQAASRTGTGTKVAIVDVGFANLIDDQIAGAMPLDPQLTKINHCGSGMTGFDGSGPSGTLPPQSHGTGVAEIVHQMAPDAALTLICVFTDADVSLAEADINIAHIPIVNMSLGDTLGGRGDGTGAPGSMAAAVALGRAHGELWTVSAGNSAQRHLKFAGRDVDADGAVEIFPAAQTTPGSDASEVASFVLGANQTAEVNMKWDAWPTTSQEFDMCLWQDTVSANTMVRCAANNQAQSPNPPIDGLPWQNVTGNPHRYFLAVFAAGNPINNRIDIYFEGEESQIADYSISGSLSEPATSPNVLTAGAHCFANAAIEPFSAAGPTIDGRMKPELTGPDGVSNNRFGAATVAGNTCTFQSGFYGTSSAAPHTAGAAALVKGQFPSLTTDQLKSYLIARAVPLGPAAADPNQAGVGKLDLGSLLSLPQHDPIGRLDVASRAPNGARIAGWVIDPDTAASTSIAVYDNGAFAGTFPASSSRPDVGTAFAGYGAPHGYDVTLPLSAGVHVLCINGVNAAGTRGVERNVGGCPSVLISGTPFGSLDLVARAPGGVRMSGWSIDPDTSSPNSVDSYVDGIGTGVTANISRPDVAAIYPSYGALHGFSAVVPAGPGTHSACSYGINTVGSGGNSLLGCRSFNVSSDPFGNLDSVTRVPGGYQVSGWSIDPDAAGPTEVHVYIDGGGTNLGLASASRPDVGQVFPDWGPNHGFTATVGGGISAGVHTLCAYGINVGPGGNTTLRCLTFGVSGDSFGQVDSMLISGSNVTGAGWAIDPDTSGPVQVFVLVDGSGVSGPANGSRPDVGAAFPAYGALHGYSIATNFPVGTHTACAYAVNASGPGSTVLLGCRTLTR